MTDQRILDAFFGGSGSAGSTPQYLITSSNANTLVLDPRGHFKYEPTNLLFTTGQPNMLPMAAYAQERSVSFLNMKHPQAEEVAKVLQTMDLYNTAETELGIRMYCPLPCEDCEMAMQCAVADEDKRLRIAKPRQTSDDGAIFF